MTFRSFALTAALVVGAAGTIVLAQRGNADWTQWRGPNRDGSAPSFTPPKAWPENLTQRWKVEVGLGYATPLVVGNRVYTFSRRDDNEVVAALDAATGKQIWQAQYPAPYTVVKAAAPHGLGPKATPAFADGRLFTHGISGILSAFDAATGKMLWQKPAPAAGPMFTTSQSPIVDRGLLIVHVGGNKEGGLTAFDPATGNQRWAWSGDGPGYGSPVVAEIAGTRQVIVPTYQNLVGVSAETGELLWRRAHKARSDVNAITPIVRGDTVISSGTEVGIVAVKITKQGNQWTAQDTWLNTDAYFQLSNGAIVRDALFGLSSVGSGTYVIVDLKSGKVLWSGEPRAANNAAMLTAGDLVLILENDGELIVADGTKTSGLTPIKRYKVSDTPTWGAPAVSGNRILVKDESTVTLWTVE
jgi:outer membrane protein assembly factor BamB